MTAISSLRHYLNNEVTKTAIADYHSKDSINVIKKQVDTQESFNEKLKIVNAETRCLLKGRLSYLKFYGPPNFGRTPDIDKPEYAYILQADSNFLFRDTSFGVSHYEKIKSVHLIDDNFQLDNFIGKNVQLYCVLSSATTGHHHAPAIAYQILNIRDINVDDSPIEMTVNDRLKRFLSEITPRYSIFMITPKDLLTESSLDSDYFKRHADEIVDPSVYEGVILENTDSYDGNPSGELVSALKIEVRKIIRISNWHVKGGYSDEFKPNDIIWLEYSEPFSQLERSKAQILIKERIIPGQSVQFSAIWEGGNHTGAYILNHLVTIPK